jgi:hypothetical protein
MGTIPFIVAVLCASGVAAEPCAPARQIGSLDQRLIPEASGMAASAAFPGRLYFINDGGNGPFFFVTNMHGRIEQSVRMSGSEDRQADYEGMSLGPCLDGKSCLFIGDIGDNRARRTHVELLIFEEVARFTTPATPLHRVRLAYPDGPHDAEGLAVDPNGDVYVLTKGMDYQARHAFPSKLFRLRRSQWEQAEGPQTLAFLGEIDLSRIAAKESGLRALAATGFDISSDGSKFVVLTCANAFEFPIRLGDAELDLERQLALHRFRTIPLRRLPQQECIAYQSQGRGLLYATESHGKPAKIMQVTCDEGSRELR